MSYPESKYDGADGSLDRDIEEADYRLRIVQAEIDDLEEDDEEEHKEEIKELKDEETKLKAFLGISEW